MPSGEALELCPADPAGGEWALVATGFQFGRCQCYFRPSGWGLLWVHARCLEGVFVVVEDWGGAVEGEAQHLTIGRCVIAGHSWHISFWIKFQTCVLHDFANRNNGAFAGHHGGGAYLKDLQDVGGVARPEGRNGSRHGFVVAAFEGGHNFVIFLAGIEVFGLVVDPLAQRATHRVPPLNFSLSLCANAECSDCQSSQGFFVVHKFSLKGCVSQ